MAKKSKDYFEPLYEERKCPYRDKCPSHPMRCSECKHNPKKDFYEPNPWKPQPWPITPELTPNLWRDWKPIWTWG